jgi:hypothetical protein
MANSTKLAPQVIGYALGLASLFVMVYVAGKAWHQSEK